METLKGELSISKDLDHARLVYLVKKTKNIEKTLSRQLLNKKICKEKTVSHKYWLKL